MIKKLFWQLFIALTLSAAFAIATAEPVRSAELTVAHQTSHGKNSPNIYAPGGHVQVVTADAAELTRLLLGSSDKTSKAIAAKLQAGDFEGAGGLVENALLRSEFGNKQQAEYRSAKSTIALSQGKPVTAENAIAQAVALAPDNCEYLGRWGDLLSNLGRISAANLRAGRGSEAANQCIRRGKPVDRLRLAIVRMVIDADIRHEEKYEQDMRVAEDAVSELLESKGNTNWNAAALTCMVATGAANVGFKEGVSRRRAYLEIACSKLADLAAVKAPSMAQLVSGHLATEETRNNNILSIERQIKILRRNPKIGELGLDRARADIGLGSLLSDLGFAILWSKSPDLVKVGTLYEEAYAFLKTYASARYPIALDAFMQHTLRVNHFNELNPSRALKLSVRDDVASIARRINIPAPESYPMLCMALTKLDRLLRTQYSGLQIEYLHGVTHARDSCIVEASDPGTRAHRMMLVASLQVDIELAIQQGNLELGLKVADRAIQLKQELAGFPDYAEKGHEYLSLLMQRGKIYFDLQRFRGAHEDFVLAYKVAKDRGNILYTILNAKNVVASFSRAYPDDITGTIRGTENWLEAASLPFASKEFHCLDVFHFLEARQQMVMWALAARLFRRVEAELVALDNDVEKIRDCKSYDGVTELRHNEKLMDAIVVISSDLLLVKSSISIGTDGQSLIIHDSFLYRVADKFKESGFPLPNGNWPVMSQVYSYWRTSNIPSPADGKN